MTELPLPAPTEVDRPFWEAAREGRLAVQRCVSCGRFQHPATVTCPLCAGRMEWTSAEGAGQVHTFTVFHRAYHPAFAEQLPYNVSVIELAEGPLMLSNVVDVAPSDLRVGLPVAVEFDPVSEEITLPRFHRRT